MSSTEDLLQDHILIRRLGVFIEKCYTLRNEDKEIPMGDLVKIADIIEQFVDIFHHGKEENATFQKLKVEALLRREQKIRDRT